VAGVGSDLVELVLKCRHYMNLFLRLNA
jgi:hypothetical protein